ncbi:MAG: PqqD family protein [Planctomycetota bacterium]|jgi:hypothetical protein
MARKNERKTRGKAVSPREPLRAVVYRNEAMKVEDRPGGRCLVTVPLRHPRWLVPPISWILPFSSSRRVELDVLGTEVFEMCDGKRVIEEIIENFAANHKLSFREAQLSVGTFLKQLTQRGLIAIVGKSKGTQNR